MAYRKSPEVLHVVLPLRTSLSPIPSHTEHSQLRATRFTLGGEAVPNVERNSMTNMLCRWTFAIVGDIDEQQKDQLLAVMSHLIDLEELDSSLSDSAVGLNLGDGTLEISLVALGDTSEESMTRATQAIRLALTNSGVIAAGLLENDESPRNSVVFEPVQLTAIA